MEDEPLHPAIHLLLAREHPNRIVRQGQPSVNGNAVYRQPILRHRLAAFTKGENLMLLTFEMEPARQTGVLARTATGLPHIQIRRRTHRRLQHRHHLRRQNLPIRIGHRRRKRRFGIRLNQFKQLITASLRQANTLSEGSFPRCKLSPPRFEPLERIDALFDRINRGRHLSWRWLGRSVSILDIHTGSTREQNDQPQNQEGKKE